MNTAFESIKRVLKEAIEHADGRRPETRVHRPRPVDVRALRVKVGMTQEQFAARFVFLDCDAASLGARRSQAARAGAGVAQRD